MYAARESIHVKTLYMYIYIGISQPKFMYATRMDDKYSSMVVVVRLTYPPLEWKWFLCYKYLLVGVIFNCKANMIECIQALFSIDAFLCE